jgi:hypothetical protein
MNFNEKPGKLGFSKDFVILVVTVVLIAFIGPPVLDTIGHHQERNNKYEDALKRVEKAGGWENIKNASLLFFTNIQSKTYFDEVYFWRGERKTTNPLPPVLELLQPWRIQCWRDSNNIPILRLKLYGIHRTGRYSEPYYAIWVVCTNVPPNYVPQLTGDSAGRIGKIEPKGNLIFEVR